MSKVERAQSPRWVELGQQQKAAVVEAVVASVDEGLAPTIADLATRAGISRPTFYKYFPTLGAAMLHTQEVLLMRVGVVVLERGAPDLNGRDRLLSFFEIGFDYTCEHPEVARFFDYFDHAFRQHGWSNHEQAEYVRNTAAVFKPMLELFEAGQADGSIRTDLDPETMFLTVQASVVGMRQRLLIEGTWTTGTDAQAREAHTALVELWRAALTP